MYGNNCHYHYVESLPAWVNVQQTEKSPPYMVRKLMMGGQRQTRRICQQDIGGDNKGLKWKTH